MRTCTHRDSNPLVLACSTFLVVAACGSSLSSTDGVGDAVLSDGAHADVAGADGGQDSSAPDLADDLAPTGGCTVGLKECGAQAYCAVPKGNCGEKGSCVPRPTECLKVDMPVCACGGGNFANACEAAMNGQSVDYDGPCPPAPVQTCTVGDSKTCPANFFCQGAPGQCSGQGACVPTPVGTCISEYPAVCGCDGTTYADECEAATGGTNVAFNGPCTGKQLCQSYKTALFKPCPEGTFCFYPNDKCTDNYGTCEAPPATCAPGASSVCGCDGVNYENVCKARQAGTGFKFVGSCSITCTVGDNSNCPADKFCQGFCGKQGVCVSKPKSCQGNYSPICGCDGKTYNNSCKAKAVGVSFASNGPCQ